MRTRFSKNLIYLFVFLLILAGVYSFSGFETEPPEKVPISKVVEQIKNDEVEKIEVADGKLTIKLKDQEKPETSTIPADQSITTILKDYGVDPAEVKELDIKEKGNTDLWINIALSILPFLFIVGFFYFMMRQAQAGQNQALSFGRSRARLFMADKKKVTFQDVAGLIEAKQELTEIVEFLKYPEKFISLGARIPKGVILVGLPGTGKTLLAKAAAGEAGVPFFSISGSEFVEMFVGVGASRVRDLFLKAKRNAPCIVFIDEIDAVGRQRGAGLGGSHDEREQTLNQILVEMDGFETDTNVIVMAATNRPDVLDPALLRPGRFDRRIILDPPDIKSRKEIMEVHTVGKPLDKDVDLEKIAKQTPGFSGADLANLVNEAAILAARRNKRKIGMNEFYESVEKVLLGPERKSHLLTPKEKKITAYHESGHALASHILPHCNPVHKVSIVARGVSGGVTWALPQEDKHLYSKSDFKDQLAMMLAGRVAEKLVFGEITTGAENDLREATKLARKMVTEYGMSEKLGYRVFGHKEELVFLGRELGEQKNYSEEIAAEIDKEVGKFIEEAENKATEVLTKFKDKLELIAQKLIAEETIEGDEFEKFFSEIKVKKEALAQTKKKESPKKEAVNK